MLFERELKQNHGISAYIDTQRRDSAVQFPERLREAIRNCDVFVCILAPTTLASEWVREEIRVAWEAAKPMVPVCQEAFVFPDSAHEVEAHIRALLNYECVHLLDRRNIHVDHTISDLARMVQASVAPS
jgi:hypothetical protein